MLVAVPDLLVVVQLDKVGYRRVPLLDGEAVEVGRAGAVDFARFPARKLLVALQENAEPLSEQTNLSSGTPVLIAISRATT